MRLEDPTPRHAATTPSTIGKSCGTNKSKATTIHNESRPRSWEGTGKKQFPHSLSSPSVALLPYTQMNVTIKEYEMNRDRLEEYMAFPVRAEGPRQADAWLIAVD